MGVLFRIANIDKDNPIFAQLLKLGSQNIDLFLASNIIGTVGAFIKIMSAYTEGWDKIVLQNLGRFNKQVLKSDQKGRIAGFISIIHKLQPVGAINYLFKPYQEKYPNDKKTIGYTHLYIAKNLLEQGDKKTAKQHLQQAHNLIQAIDHAETLEEINQLLTEAKATDI